MDTLSRIMAKVKVNETPHPVLGTPCWEWQGFCRKGYGRIKVKSRGWQVHRLMFVLKNGEIPKEKLVCHRCDNRRCCNLDHLFAGTNQDNMDDMVSKDRRPAKYGDDHPRSILTDAQVEEIRGLAGLKRQCDLAKMFGVSQAHISRIILKTDRIGPARRKIYASKPVDLR